MYIHYCGACEGGGAGVFADKRDRALEGMIFSRIRGSGRGTAGLYDVSWTGNTRRTGKTSRRIG